MVARIDGIRGRGKATIMKFIATADRDEDGVSTAACPSIPGCVSQGESREMAFQNLQGSNVLCLEVRAEQGLPLPEKTIASTTINVGASLWLGIQAFPMRVT